MMMNVAHEMFAQNFQHGYYYFLTCFDIHLIYWLYISICS